MINRNKKRAFKKLLDDTIRQKCKDFTARNGMITFENGKKVVESIEQVFQKYLGFVPGRITKYCTRSLNSISPDAVALDDAETRRAKGIIIFLLSLFGLVFLVFGIVGICWLFSHPQPGIRLPWGLIILYLLCIVLGTFKIVTAIWVYATRNAPASAMHFTKCLVHDTNLTVDKLWKWHAATIEKNLEENPPKND